MPNQDPPSNPQSNTREKAEREEQSSGKDEGDRVEGGALAEAENVERNSGRDPDGILTAPSRTRQTKT